MPYICIPSSKPVPSDAMRPPSGRIMNSKSSSAGSPTTRWLAASFLAQVGKRGGARVVYYNLLDDGVIWLLMAYTKAKFDNLPTNFLSQLLEEIERG